MYELEKIGPATFLMPQKEGMLVPGLIIATEELLKDPEMEKPLKQVENVAYLKGIVNYSIAMPDMHWGYGFPIGGVAATDVETGVISPGGVGYDINCGVRLATISLPLSSLSEKTKTDLLNRLFSLIPSGVGHGHRGGKILKESDYEKLMTKGARWSIEEGYGLTRDLDHIESNGVLSGSDPSAVSTIAKERGRNQLGTIGSGNHFVEVGEIETIYDEKIASDWNIKKGDISILIHSGSRGLGHQVCQDTLDTFVRAGFTKNLRDPQLASAPIQSSYGKQYFAAMSAAANYAFNNRQQLLYAVRQAFLQVCNIQAEEIRLLYDVCHNIAKIEEYEVLGKVRKLCVHRKGATRAFGANNKELNPLFQKTGQPVLVPGDMGRASHLLAGLGNPLTWCSSCHGAGRAKSRIKSLTSWNGKNLEEVMKAQGILVKASSFKTVAEEMPDAYKDVDVVVDAVEKAGLAKKVARMNPSLVIKG